MDLTKLSDSDLSALKSGDLTKLSDEGLTALRGGDARTRAAEANARFMRDAASPDMAARGGQMALEGMSGPETFAAGVGKSVIDTGRGIGQLVGAYSGQDAAETKRRDEALMSSGEGMSGNVVGQIGMMLAPGAAMTRVARLANAGRIMLAPRTLKQAAAVGAAFGALGPGEGDSAADVLVDRAQSAAGGAAGGAGGLLAGRALMSGVNAAKALAEPFYRGGQDKIIARTLERFAANPASVAQARSTQLVPGSIPTLAESTGDAGISQLTRSLVNESPQFAADLGARQVAQNSARLNVLQGIAGQPGARVAAELARKQATAPLYSKVAESTALVDPSRTVGLINKVIAKNPARKQLTSALSEVRESLFESYPVQQRGKDGWKAVSDVIGKRMSSADDEAVKAARTVMDRVRKGSIGADEALSQLKGISAKSKTASEAIALAKQYMKTPDYVVRQEPNAIKSAIQNIGDMIERKGPDGARVNEAVVRELSIVKKSLELQLGKVEPAYAQAQRTFATMSRPIDQMKIGEELLERGASALPKSGNESKLYAEQLARLIRGDDKLVKSATGFARNKGLASVMEPRQMQSLDALVRDLARSTAAQESVRAVGSNTAQNLVGQNLLRQTMTPVGAPQSWSESAILGTLARPVDFAAKYPEQVIQRRLAEALLNSQVASTAMSKVATTPAQAQRKALIDALIRNASVTLPVGTLNAAQ